MALEIERRFLVAGEQWREHVQWSRHLMQGYLAGGADGLTLRVRSDGLGAAWLTLKLPAEGIARHEFEYNIPALDAEALLELSEARVRKERFGLDLPGGDWVLDVFGAENAPLVIAEVELSSEQAAVAIPAWCRCEITGIGAFSNAALAQRPFQHWDPAERERWLLDLNPQQA
jgi:CYTH domain-containing protein